MELSPTYDHVLLFPYPVNGHIKPFLCLAKLLCRAGLRVTFLNTEYNHLRIQNRDHLATQFPSLHFEYISDGLPLDEARDLFSAKFHESIANSVTRFRELFISLKGGSSGRPPLTCLITDVVVSFPIDVAEELGVPVFCFCTYSACYLFLYFWVQKLIEDGHLPFPVGKLEEEVNAGGAPAEVEEFLRYKHLPGCWGFEGEIQHTNLEALMKPVLSTPRCSAVILNTFPELEAPFLTSLSKIYDKIYTMGPIHSLNDNDNDNNFHSVLAKEDDSCLPWLDSQPSRSVVFVSFGSLVRMESSQLMEFWHGLVSSGNSFLLVLRSDVVEEDDEKKLVHREILETKSEGRWLIVNWAPQEKVLAHPAIGGFLTHSGWNSTLESILAQVPMITWPLIGDQHSNSMMVSKVWKIGLELEGNCNRFMVKTMVTSILKNQQDEEIRKRVAELAKRAKDQVNKDGTSYCDFQTLVHHIKSLK